MNIVLAEDEKDTREYLAELLGRMGHQVVPVPDGKSLVEVAVAARPDLVITDVRLGDGTDGINASHAINQQHEVPVILVSAYHDAETLERTVVDHIMGYLVKPVQEAHLKVAIHLAKRRFDHYLSVRKETNDLRQALEDRKLIERAKGVVMRRLRVDEEEAFRRLQKQASRRACKLVEVAREVIASEEVFQFLERT